MEGSGGPAFDQQRDVASDRCLREGVIGLLNSVGDAVTGDAGEPHGEALDNFIDLHGFLSGHTSLLCRTNDRSTGRRLRFPERLLSNSTLSTGCRALRDEHDSRPTSKLAGSGKSS